MDLLASRYPKKSSKKLPKLKGKNTYTKPEKTSQEIGTPSLSESLEQIDMFSKEIVNLDIQHKE